MILAVRFQRVFGRKGRGPGEFRFVSSAGFVAGDLVGFGDDHAFELELFELGSGKHIGAAKMSPSTLVDDCAVRGDTLWFAGIDTDVHERGLVVGFAASPCVLSTSHSGVVQDTASIPVARRRGLPEEDELLALEPGPGVTDIFGSVSLLLKVSRDSMGFVHTIRTVIRTFRIDPVNCTGEVVGK